MDMKKILQNIEGSSIYAWITSAIGAWTISDWAVLIGIIVTIASYVRETRFKKRIMEINEIKLGLRRNRSGKVVDEKKQ